LRDGGGGLGNFQKKESCATKTVEIIVQGNHRPSKNRPSTFYYPEILAPKKNAQPKGEQKIHASEKN